MARILVVDDEEGVRSFLADALTGDGHVVTQAGDGLAAKRLLDEQAFELIITDLRMPELDGMALLRHVSEEQPDVEVVVLTAHGSVASAVEAMKRGAFDFLEKPVSSPAALRLLASRALERRHLRTFREGASRATEKAPPLTYGDPVMAPVVKALEKVSRTDATVLLLGESGTGKEVAARRIHAQSARATGPFMAVNCAVLSSNLLESELFGHERGAFTDARERRRGRLELADGGTFFLDEVSELSPPLQAKLLRVLEERVFERLGGSRTLRANVRWIAATNSNLKAMITAGDFREDLYHRLAVFPVRLPPLRERRLDLLPIAQHLLLPIGRELGHTRLALSDEASDLLRAGSWPGNVRQLRNSLERAAILSEGGVIAPRDLLLDDAAKPRAREGTLKEIEREAILSALAEENGNRRRAAERLGIGLRTLYERLKRYEQE